ncbi:hypothetical protein IQ258_23785 [Coleofasciculus sp. LEGE 07081]|uniref:hypothetical protein n=1 Tax=Coleofasciculus sp. LEGE 07081 TaxID=2777967 RepID=UPI00187F757F|nr:hypothetical protein [Coleofasciculus sp. LEGE 07081]MBE9129089.1 hypothetical protein [Coleofasciculus sp. LEGE 07081]
MQPPSRVNRSKDLKKGRGDWRFWQKNPELKTAYPFALWLFLGSGLLFLSVYDMEMNSYFQWIPTPDPRCQPPDPDKPYEVYEQIGARCEKRDYSEDFTKTPEDRIRVGASESEETLYPSSVTLGK